MRRSDDGHRDTGGGTLAGMDDPGRMDPDRYGALSQLPRRDPLVRHARRAALTDRPRWPLALRDVPRRGIVPAPAEEPWSNAIAAGLGALAIAVAIVVFLGITAVEPAP